MIKQQTAISGITQNATGLAICQSGRRQANRHRPQIAFQEWGIKSQTSQKLAAQGFSGGGLWATDGIPAHEVVVVLEYYAYDSRVKSESARRWLLTLSAKTINDWILAQCGRSTLSTRKQELNQKIKEEPQRIQLRGESKQAHSFWREQGEACQATDWDYKMQNASINGEAFGFKGTNGYPSINEAIEASGRQVGTWAVP